MGGHIPCVKVEDSLRQQDQATGSMAMIMDQAAMAHQPYPSPVVTANGPSSSELDISLSSTVDLNEDLGFLLPLDSAMFDQLSPALNPEDFTCSFTMDNSTEGIHELFDI